MTLIFIVFNLTCIGTYPTPKSSCQQLLDIEVSITCKCISTCHVFISFPHFFITLYPLSPSVIFWIYLTASSLLPRGLKKNSQLYISFGMKSIMLFQSSCNYNFKISSLSTLYRLLIIKVFVTIFNNLQVIYIRMSTFMILIYYDYQFIAEINQSFIQQIKPKIDDFLLPMASFRTCTHTTHKCH